MRPAPASVNQAVIDALVFVYGYASNLDDWIRLKKQLMSLLQPSQRCDFSTRDPITKKQSMNDYERDVAALWSDMTGRPVIFTQDE